MNSIDTNVQLCIYAYYGKWELFENALSKHEYKPLMKAILMDELLRHAILHGCRYYTNFSINLYKEYNDVLPSEFLSEIKDRFIMSKLEHDFIKVEPQNLLYPDCLLEKDITKDLLKYNAVKEIIYLCGYKSFDIGNYKVEKDLKRLNLHEYYFYEKEEYTIDTLYDYNPDCIQPLTLYSCNFEDCIYNYIISNNICLNFLSNYVDSNNIDRNTLDALYFYKNNQFIDKCSNRLANVNPEYGKFLYHSRPVCFYYEPNTQNIKSLIYF